MNLNFIQSNWLRQYPFKSDQGITDLNNVFVPKDIIVGLRITCQYTDLDVYINKIYTNAGNVGVSFSGSNGDIGYSIGKVTDDNQSISIVNYNGGIIGNVTIGNMINTQPNQTFIFDNTAGLIEPSTVLILPLPAVTGINIKGNKYTGNVVLNSSTLNIIEDEALLISVKNPSSIKSRGDKKPEYLTCTNNVISGINSVQPNHEGNIDIYAIEPLSISSETINGVLQLQLKTPKLGLDETLPEWMIGLDEVKNLCKLTNIPPANTADVYPDISTITQETKPEWSSWPQYD